MEKYISDNIKKIQISGIRKFYNKVVKVKDAISLTLGQPDFQVPEAIKQGIINAVNSNKTVYTANAGLKELRDEISEFLKEFSIKYSPEEICITIGGSEALMSLFAAIVNPGDKILVPNPAYPAYESVVKLLGGEVVNYDLNKDFSINLEVLSKLLDQGQYKALVVSYPSNPTGALLSREDALKLSALLKTKELLIVSDEIYSALCFEDNYYSISQVDEIRDRVILVGGFSKMFSMTGLRLGYVCADEKLMEHIMKAHQYNVSCAPSIVQYGVYEGFRKAFPAVEHMRKEFMKRRDYVYKRLADMGMDVVMPKGAFYIFPSIKKFGLNSEEFCERLLNEAKVAVVPGTAFGSGGEGYIRLSYCYSDAELKEALDRMECWINNLALMEAAVD